jgi:hypothetical protein
LSGRESGRTPPGSQPAADPNGLEVVPGAARDRLEGWSPELADPDQLRAALEQAFDYRGDVRITRKDGSQIEGYVFDRRPGKTLADSSVRLLPNDGGPKIAIAYDDIVRLAFTGRDMAAGKNWEAWVRHYWEKKAAGERDISLQPERLE